MNKMQNNLDDYEHIKLIGEGFFSLVQEYRNKRTKEHVAFKILKEKFKDDTDYKHRFEREINLLQQLSGHPNIIELIDYGYKDEKPFYIMPSAKINLDENITKNNDNLSLKKRVALFDQILEAMTFAHSRNILHRDISPTNVLLFDEEERLLVKVSDFGLSKNWAEDSGFTLSVVAKYGQVIYTAPEQFDKLKDATERSDIFALGKLLDFVLTGKKPVGIRSTDGFRTVIEKATHPEPELRYENIEDFKDSYEIVKKLIMSDDEDDINGLIPFKNDDGSINWIKFHKFAVKGEYIEEVYGDYIKVVVEILLDTNNSREYVRVVKQNVRGFVETFSQRLDELPPTRWPFKEVGNFATVLKNIYFLTNDETTKLLCLKIIWSYAYEADQWSVQSIMQRLFDGKHIPESLHERFAIEIVNSKAKIKIDDFTNSNIPPVIRRAIINRAKQNR